MSLRKIRVNEKKKHKDLLKKFKFMLSETWFIMLFTVRELKGYELDREERQCDKGLELSKKLCDMVNFFSTELRDTEKQNLLMPRRKFVENTLNN